VKKIAGLLLAAGASSRMGRPKQLLPLGRRSLLEHAIRQALGSEIDVLFLVLGSHAKEIRESIAPDLLESRLRIVENPCFHEGISTSILSGIRQIEPVYEHTLILLGDMPWITSALINRLIEEYLRSGLSLGAVRSGHGRTLPVIVGRKFYPYLHELHGDVGARELFLRFPREVCLVEPEGPYEDSDIDTPEEYEAARKLWEGSAPANEDPSRPSGTKDGKSGRHAH
jgi:molybdenum cofactor cytidylyltransferase